MSTVITVENLGKKYTLRHQSGQQPYVALRDVITERAAAIGRKLLHPFSSSHPTPHSSQEEFWALKDVSFEVKQGDRIGIIGRNGAGKSTLLKILSRITEPTTGSVRIKGRVASLLEVGTGFHPELTGRENIYLNGAILGMHRAEIKKKFDEIVDFAEIEKFLDTPVKRYSSGMYVRLAFAVAAHLEPEILVVDEVLAVGDAQFQKKCLGKMEDVSAKEGRTVLFVSHNLDAVKWLCSKGIHLTCGALEFAGSSSDSINNYLAASVATSSQYQSDFDKRQRAGWWIGKAWLEQDGVLVEIVANDTPLDLFIEVNGATDERFSFEVLLKDQNHHPVIFIPLGLGLGIAHDLKPGTYLFRLRLTMPYLATGEYFLDLMVAESGRRFFDQVESALKFFVQNNFNETTGWVFRQERAQGCLFIDTVEVSLVDQGNKP
jgi:lipopolysaccharide transport system ATP-binding protein